MSRFDIEALRFRLRERAPYFSSIIWAIRPVADEGFGFRDERGGVHGTFAVTENGILVYNPSVDWTFEECLGGLCHEIHHLVLKHAKTRLDRDPMLWNIACDLSINSGLRRGKWILPGLAIYPELYGLPDNETPEFYYNHLPVREIKVAVLGPGTGRCGSCAGQKEEDEPSGHGEGAGNDEAGDASEVSGLTEVELDALAKRVAEDVVKNRGAAPADLERWAEDFLHPHVPWQRVLRAAVKRCVNIVSGGATDYSFLKSNDRRNDTDLILPKLVTYKPEVAVVFDTSGSMGQKEFAEGVTEVYGIVRHLTQAITVLDVDAAVHGIHKLSSRAQILGTRLKGGGGTDMRIGIERALKLHPRPNIVVVFTDGDTPWPEDRPRGAQVVVCLSSAGAGVETAPSWAKVVKIN